MTKAVCPPQNSYRSNRKRDGRNTSEIPTLIFAVAVAKFRQFACLNLLGYFHLAVKYTKEETKTNKQNQETCPLNLF